MPFGEIVIDEQKEMESLHKAIALGAYPRVCDLCRGNTTSFITNKDKEGNIYIKIRCKCGGESKLGQYKVGGYFWNEFKKWTPEDQPSTVKPTYPEYAPAKTQGDDVPF